MTLTSPPTDHRSLSSPGLDAGLVDGRDDRPYLLRCGRGEHLFVLENAPLSGAALADVVIVPPYGKTVMDLLVLAHYLRANGFHVVRFDARNHLGRATGDIIDFRLSSLQRDLALVLNTRQDSGRPLILFGASLSLPVTLRCAARRPGVAGVVSLVGVVDVVETLERATGLTVGAYRRREAGVEPCPEVLGFRVRGVEFIDDMDIHGYADFAATCTSARAVRAPVHFVAAAADELVDIEKVHRLVGLLSARSHLTVIEGCSHELARSIPALRQALAAITGNCLAIAEGADHRVAIDPPLTTFIEASGAEADLLTAFDSASPEARAA